MKRKPPTTRNTPQKRIAELTKQGNLDLASEVAHFGRELSSLERQIWLHLETIKQFKKLKSGEAPVLDHWTTEQAIKLYEKMGKKESIQLANIFLVAIQSLNLAKLNEICKAAEFIKCGIKTYDLHARLLSLKQLLDEDGAKLQMKEIAKIVYSPANFAAFSPSFPALSELCKELNFSVQPTPPGRGEKKPSKWLASLIRKK